MIKAIVFDYGGVIVKMKEHTAKKIREYLGVEKFNWSREYFSKNQLANIEGISYEELFVLVSKNLGATDEQTHHVLEIMKENKKSEKINTELIEIIRKLKKNYKIGLLSNNIPSLRKDLIEKDLIGNFDSVVISSEVGYQKPQREIFEVSFKELEVKNEEVIFIDDSKESLATSSEIGYIPILYKDNKSLLEEFKNLGIIL